MDWVLGGTAASLAGLLTNPLEVIKIRMQLQGELRGKGTYAVHYRNVFHAGYNIVKLEGTGALLKGVSSFAGFLFVINGIRLGSYQTLTNFGLTKNEDGSVSSVGTFVCGAGCGALGAFVSSPLYLVKTRLQSLAHASIAVGHQHHQHIQGGSASGVLQALVLIQKENGVPGLWRGATSSIVRVGVASSMQLLCFEKSREFAEVNLGTKGLWTPLLSACFIAGLFSSTAMAPFDLIATRFYNQPIDSNSGKGLLYSGLKDCFVKVCAKEGLAAFFKGWTAVYFRFGPFCFFNLIFWDRLKEGYKIYNKKVRV